MRVPLLVLAALAALTAAPAWAAPEAPSVPVERYTLDNGLTVLLSEDHRLPVVAVEIRYLVGSAHELPGKSGFAHLFEHLMFQGSAHFDKEYFEPYEPIGGAVNGTTNTDRTNYYERVPSNYLETALWMESDRMEGLLGALTLDKLNNQRDVVKNERRQSYENRPYGMVWKYFANLLYPEGHPYHHTTIGSHADLTGASLDDVKAFFRQYYVPANAVVTVVGDFEPGHTRALIERYFGHMPSGARAATPQAVRPTLTASHHTFEDTVKLPRVYLAWHTPALYEAGDSAMDVLASVLTDGKSSRLYKPLVYEQKVAKDVTAYQVSKRLGGFFVIQATAAPGQSAEQVATALKVALTRALATPPTEDEMTRVINGWRKSFYGRVESVLSRAQLLSGYLDFTGKADYLAEDLARYTALTPAEVAKWGQTLRGPALRIDIVPGAKTEGGAQ